MNKDPQEAGKAQMAIRRWNGQGKALTLRIVRPSEEVEEVMTKMGFKKINDEGEWYNEEKNYTASIGVAGVKKTILPSRI